MRKLLVAAALFLSLSIGAGQASADPGTVDTTITSNSAGVTWESSGTYLDAGVTWE
jgi:hypothetical protein